MRILRVLTAAALLGAFPIAASAATFTVDTTTLDAGDIAPGDGECAWATFPPVGQRCTLRAAIMEANALPGADRVIVPFGATIVLDNAGRDEDAGALGDLDITGPLEIQTISLSDPASSPTIDANGIDRVFDVHYSAIEVHLVNLRITGGAADDATTFLGGGVRSQVPLLHLWFCDIVGNAANGGGGLFLTHSLDMVGSDVHGNVVTDLGFTNVDGSAIRDSDSGAEPGNTISIRASTIRANLALGGPGTHAAVIVRTPLVVENSTFSGNLPNALHVYGADATLTHATITGSQNGYSFGGPTLQSDSVVRNTVIAGNAVADCVFFASHATSHAYTLDGDGSCQLTFGVGNLPGADARLRPLAVRFGRVAVHDLGAGSEAIDAADPLLQGAGGTCLGSDQDGIDRPLDGDGGGARCDMGAIEFLDPIFVDGFEPPPR